jgi:hypothetical protein
MARIAESLDAKNRKSRGGFAVIVVTLAVLASMLAYPLSAGPVGWIIIQYGRPPWVQPYFDTFYGPAYWLQSHDPSRLLTAYYNWWW